jgi:hypothetical protein
MIRRKQFRAEIAVLTASCALGFVLSACSGPTQADIVGTYSRADNGVTETIEIRKDGSFEQTVQPARAITLGRCAQHGRKSREGSRFPPSTKHMIQRQGLG